MFLGGVGWRGADPVGLGSGVAEVAGYDCDGGVCRILGGQDGGKLGVEGEEDRV